MAQRLLTDPDPSLRGTFEELMLKGGEFRWRRLDELLRESQKSQGFSGGQLWLAADWFLSDGAARIRDKVAEVRNGPTSLSLQGAALVAYIRSIFQGRSIIW